MDSHYYRPLLREESLSVRVADLLEQMIRDGELKIGERIPTERILCERFKVSRTVIREAISYLTAKGLLVSQSSNGTFVRNVESSDVARYLGLHLSLQNIPAGIEHFLEVRRVLEIQIAKLAAQRADKPIVQALDENLKTIQTLLPFPEEFAKKDVEFHLLLARATKNPLFESMLNPLIEGLLEVVLLTLVYEKAGEEAIGFHTRIYEQIRDGNVEGAGFEMEQHLCQVRKAVLAAMEKMNSEIKYPNRKGETA